MSVFRLLKLGFLGAGRIAGGIIDTTSKLLLDLFANDFEVANEVSTFNQTVSHSASTNGTMTGGYGPNIVAGQTWTISDPAWTDNGDGSFTGVSASGFTLEVAGILEANKVYQVEFEVYDYVSGTLDIRVGNSSPAGANATSNGTYTVLQPQNGNLHFYLFPVSLFTGSVRNISVREMPAIKWRPHNLLTYAENISSGWAFVPIYHDIIDGATTPPVGYPQASKLISVNSGTSGEVSITSPSISYAANVKHTWKIALKADQSSWALLRTDNPSGNTMVNLSNGTYGSIAGVHETAPIISLGDGWYEVTLSYTPTITSSTVRVYVGEADLDTVFASRDGTQSIFLSSPHLYRSDLGGMVDNPDRGDSYVPTTSSAVYLPRRGHHIYNGYEWVNEGMLHESEGRTNLVTYSEGLLVQVGMVQ